MLGHSLLDKVFSGDRPSVLFMLRGYDPAYRDFAFEEYFGEESDAMVQSLLVAGVEQTTLDLPRSGFALESLVLGCG